MNKHKLLKNTVLLFGLIFVLSIVIIIVRNQSSGEKITPVNNILEKDEDDNPDIIIKPFRRDNLQGKEIRYSINAEEGRLYSNYDTSGNIISQRIEINNIKEIKINIQEDKFMTISAEKAFVFNDRHQTERIILENNIIVRHPSMGELRTNRLDFSLSNSLLHTREFFTIENEGHSFQGKGLQFHTDTSDITVMESLRGIVKMEEDDEYMYFMGNSMEYIESENLIILDENALFLFDSNRLSGKKAWIYMDKDRNIDRIVFIDDIEASFEVEGENLIKSRYDLHTNKLDIILKNGSLWKIIMEKDFFIESIIEDIYIKGYNAQIIFSEEEGETTADTIKLHDTFYFHHIDTGFYASSGIIDNSQGIIFSDNSPLLYNYPIVTQAGIINININDQHLTARDNVHTLIPEGESQNIEHTISERMDIYADILNYDLQKEIINYKNNGKILSNSLTISSNSIKLYNERQIAHFLGNVSGNIIHFNKGQDIEEKIFFDTEYMHYDAGSETILLKEESDKYPIIWQEGFRASSRSILIDQTRDYIFLSEDVHTLFFKDFYEDSSKDSEDLSFFSFDTDDTPIEIISQSLEIWNSDDKIRYSNDVHVRQGINTLHCDIMTIFIKEDNTIDRIIFTDNLSISASDSFIEGDEGFYYNDREEFHIHNNVSYRDRMTSLKNAEKLIYYIRENRYIVQGTDIQTEYRLDDTFEVPRIFPKRRSLIR